MIQNRIGRILLLTCFLFSAFYSKAQFNKNFQSVYNDPWASTILRGHSVDIINGSPGHQAVLSYMDELPATGGFTTRNRFINVKMIDFYGTVIWDHTYQAVDSALQTDPWRIIQTDDSGYIVVGRVINSRGTSNPFAFKLDNSGGMQWSNIYQSNQNYYIDSIQTVVTKVVDDTSGTESYIIARSGSSTGVFGYHPGDVLINALHIDGNGNLLWNKRYEMQNRNREDSTTRDFPTAIIHVKDSFYSYNNYYLIAGTHYNSNSPYYNQDSALFLMGIDLNGNVVKSYRRKHVGAQPLNVDALFDDGIGQNAIVLSYTINNSRIVDQRQRLNRSQIGVLKLQSDLSPIWMNYYWSYTELENRASRIKTDLFNKTYIIACNLTDSIPKPPSHIGLLKIDKSGPVIFMQRYNVFSETHSYGLLTIDSNNSSEVYDITGEQRTFLSMRVMQTDINGNTCGSERIFADYKPYHDTAIEHYYRPVDTLGVEPMDKVDVAIDVTVDNCIDADAKEFKHSTGITAPKEGTGLRMYPTLLDESNELYLETNVTKAETMEAYVYSADGRLIARKQFNITVGNMTYKWTLPAMTTGNYMVQVVGSSERKTFKVVKM